MKNHLLFSVLTSIFCATLSPSSIAAENNECDFWLSTVGNPDSYRSSTYSQDESSPEREARQRFDEMQALRDHIAFLTKHSGQPLTAKQAHLRARALEIDQFLYLGDIGPIVTRYGNLVRRVEVNYLLHQKHLAATKVLDGLIEELRATTGEIPRALRERWIKELKNYDLLAKEGDREQVLREGSFEELVALARLYQDELKAGNDRLEHELGKEFLEYRVIRNHLNFWMTADESLLLEQVDRADNRTDPAASGGKVRSSREEEGPQAPHTQLMADIAKPASIAPPKSRAKRVQERLRALQSRTHELENWIDKLGNPEEAVDMKELAAFLSKNQWSNDLIRRSLAKAKTKRGREELVLHLEILRNRLKDTHEMMRLAYKLDRALGVQRGDSVKYPELLKSGFQRPRANDISQIIYDSRIAEQAMEKDELWKQRWAFVDSTILFGFMSGWVPRVSWVASAGGRFEGPQKFVLWLFKELHSKFLEEHHYPALTLMRRASGDPAKMMELMEALNASFEGPRDEFLVTFARRTDMKDLWWKIRDAAKVLGNSDHHQLSQRMVVAEKKAQALGPLSIIRERTYHRYLVAALLYGGTTLAGGSYGVMGLVSNAAGGVKDAATVIEEAADQADKILPFSTDSSDPDDDEEKKKKELDIEAEAVEISADPGDHEAAMGAVLTLMDIAQASAQNEASFRQADALANTLMAIETKLRSRMK